MKLSLLSVAVVLVAAPLTFSGLAHSSSPNSKTDQSAAGRRIVVVELFTSEGCSSCPPADTLLKTLSEQSSIANTEVIALEQHVDYWDRLGWKDPYSSAEFTDRQTEYSHFLKDGGVYTPQMVVDGQTVVIGGRAQEVIEVIKKAASQPKAEIQLTPATGSTREKAAYDIKVSNLAALQTGEDIELWLAITEKGLQTDVKAGENSGERLQHSAIVRSLHKVDTVHGSGDHVSHATVKLQKAWHPENLSVVVFGVEKKSHKIIGADSVQLPSS
jgi:hypothetical protein